MSTQVTVRLEFNIIITDPYGCGSTSACTAFVMLDDEIEVFGGSVTGRFWHETQKESQIHVLNIVMAESKLIRKSASFYMGSIFIKANQPNLIFRQQFLETQIPRPQIPRQRVSIPETQLNEKQAARQQRFTTNKKKITRQQRFGVNSAEEKRSGREQRFDRSKSIPQRPPRRSFLKRSNLLVQEDPEVLARRAARQERFGMEAYRTANRLNGKITKEDQLHTYMQERTMNANSF